MSTSTDAALLGLLHLDHVAILTPSLGEGSAPYIALGLLPEGEDELVVSQGIKVRAFVLGETLIELLEPQDPASPVAAFMQKRGPGLHHIAFRVSDLEAEIERLSALGARFLNTEPRPGRAGSLVAFLHPKWGGGTLIELVEHPASEHSAAGHSAGTGH
ncbi:VOC family protein [Deinococcus altitudinis]|uniref:VOC family protein n=1 Tax=Deinococcus altitudinis TaxID=468914 RepID=UPI0038915968